MREISRTHREKIIMILPSNSQNNKYNFENAVYSLELDVNKNILKIRENDKDGSRSQTDKMIRELSSSLHRILNISRQSAPQPVFRGLSYSCDR